MRTEKRWSKGKIVIDLTGKGGDGDMLIGSAYDLAQQLKWDYIEILHQLRGCKNYSELVSKYEYYFGWVVYLYTTDDYDKKNALVWNNVVLQPGLDFEPPRLEVGNF